MIRPGWLAGFAIAASLFAPLPAQSQTATLELVITNLRNDRGVVLVSVDTSESWFRDGVASVRSLRLAPTNRGARASVSGLAPGEYAIRIHHDEDGDNHFDTGLFGIPTERYGFSGRSGRFGLPPFEEAKFAFPENATQHVRLR